MSKKSNPPADDKTLFRKMMEDVRPIEQDKIGPHKKKLPPRPIKREQDDQQVMVDMMSDPAELLDEIETGEELVYSRSGLQQKTLRKLRRGQLCIEAELDLHRMTADQARQATADFLQQMKFERKRCVKIIHGKGLGSFNKLPVLKRKLNHWLRQRDEVLAFCSARPVDGGTGAIYVLLRGKS